ncbi:MAG: hypothetical protein FJ291_08110 [Planctomycetes bacterium]|nr:hypothetical protein [Planctomycetota bacterium]
MTKIRNPKSEIRNWARLLAAAAGLGCLALLAVGARMAYQAIMRARQEPLPGTWTPVAVRPTTPQKVTPLLPKAKPPITCPIVPVPKVYKELGRRAELLDAPAAAIVLGANATEPERYAAERLANFIERRFLLNLPIAIEGHVEDAVRQALLLGQRGTNAWLDRLCREKKLDLTETSPGHDGFIIETVDDGGRQVVLIGGGNARGVIYGQSAFGDTLRRDGERVVFPVVSVRDWPSIAWRGRPIGVPETHLAPGVLDAYVQFRLNWLDFRDGPPPRRGQFGIPPGFAFDRSRAQRLLAEARRRALFVFGTVFCGVKPDQFPAALATCGDLIALGVDGLWISFDDPGGGEGTEALIAQIIELAKRRGIAGERIAVTPPMGSYGVIATEFNRRFAAVPGLADAVWFFTRAPNAHDAAAARQLGLSRPPSWWHNWPFPHSGGLLHESGDAARLRADGKPAYLEVPPLEMGWDSPSYETLRPAARSVHAVMCWTFWPEEYCCGALGLWAWDPAEHDWPRTRRAIYTFVFGPPHAAAARAFDDKFMELKRLFYLPRHIFRPGVTWPPHLNSPAARPRALALLDELDSLLKQLEGGAAGESMLPPERLRELYLEPMRATVDFARKMAEQDYPEYEVPELDRRVGELIAKGEVPAAEAAFREGHERLLRLAAAVPDALGGLKGLGEYTEHWRRRAAGFPDAAARANPDRASLEKRFEHYAGKAPAEALAAAARPPEGKALAELSAADWARGAIACVGPWAVGLVPPEAARAVGLARTPWEPSETHHFIELQGELPVPAAPGRLALDVFVGESACSPKVSGTRFAQLWANGRLVWEEDLTLARKGQEWATLDVTDAAKDAERLRLCFRIVNRRPAAQLESLTLLGPARLRAAPQAAK